MSYCPSNWNPYDEPWYCEACGLVDDCECPECPECGEAGHRECFGKEGHLPDHEPKVCLVDHVAQWLGCDLDVIHEHLAEHGLKIFISEDGVEFYGGITNRRAYYPCTKAVLEQAFNEAKRDVVVKQEEAF